MTAFNEGYSKRPKPRVNVVRGFNGNEPSTFTRSAPVTEGVAIVSGQVISLDDGEWVLGAAQGSIPYIALSDSTDTDVSGSGLLPALSCAGQFEIETGWFKADDTYGENTPLIAGATGLVEEGDLTDTEVDIIGFATQEGVKNLNGGPGPIVEMNATDANILTFITRWIPARVASGQ